MQESFLQKISLNMVFSNALDKNWKNWDAEYKVI